MHWGIYSEKSVDTKMLDMIRKSTENANQELKDFSEELKKIDKIEKNLGSKSTMGIGIATAAATKAINILENGAKKFIGLIKDGFEKHRTVDKARKDVV